MNSEYFGENDFERNKDEVIGIVIDIDDNVWVAGKFIGHLAIGDDYLTSNGKTDSYVAKFNNNGESLFATSFGGPNDENVSGIATDRHGRVWVTGEFHDYIGYGDRPNFLTSHGNGDKEQYVVLFDDIGINTQADPPIVTEPDKDQTYEQDLRITTISSRG